MKHHAVIATLFGVVIGLEVGAVISLITQTVWPIIVFGIIAIVLGGILLAWAKIANPVLERIRKGIEISIIELTIDIKQKQLRVTFGIRNKHPAKLTLKVIDKVIVRLNKDTTISTTIQMVSEKKQFPRCEIVKVCCVTTMSSEHITFLVTKKNEIAYWDFNIEINFDSAWGNLIYKITDLEFDQVPRLEGG